MFLLPEVEIDLGNREGPCAIGRVWGHPRRRGDDNRDGGHVPHCFGDIVSENKLEVISDVQKGFVEEGCVVRASVVEDVVGNFLDFTSEFISLLSWCRVVPLVVVAVVVPPSAMTTIISSLIVVLAGGRFNVRFDVHHRWNGRALST